MKGIMYVKTVDGSIDSYPVTLEEYANVINSFRNESHLVCRKEDVRHTYMTGHVVRLSWVPAGVNSELNRV